MRRDLVMETEEMAGERRANGKPLMRFMRSEVFPRLV